VGLWLVLAATVATLGVVFPTEMGIKADPLRPAPEGIRPEWYFLFLFKTLKLIPETLGVALFTLAALFLLLLPFLDRSALHGYRSPGFTLLFVLSLFYATLFEIMAWIEPKRCLPPQEWKSETYSLPNNLVFLVLLWTLVGFLLFYLRQLVRENVRIRQLYQRAAPGEQAEL
jgi:quinol-cytochrome oxidoreductase complex cytochrome b subunit